MFKNVLDSLEDTEHPLLGPTKWCLEIIGIYQNSKGIKRYISNLVHFAATLFVFSQYVELWIIRADLENALRNLSVSMLSTVCVVKAWTFVIWQSYWKEIMSAISRKELAQLAKEDKKTAAMINEYIKYSRLVTYFYWGLVTATVFTVILAPLAVYLSSAMYKEMIRNGTAPNPEIMSSWVPFNKTESFGYWAYILLHGIICLYGGGIVAAYDSNTVVLMNFFAGQLKLLRLDCERLFDEAVSDEEALLKIQEFHSHHLFLVKYSRLVDSMLSPVMFLYIIICSLMICASAIQLTNEGTTKMQQIWIAEYVIALIAQLFLYCWHGNEVLIMSTVVENGIYDSDWWRRNMRLRRSALLLGGQMRRSFIFNAGPFTRLTVQTFVTILKGSYSYYTILSKNGD